MYCNFLSHKSIKNSSFFQFFNFLALDVVVEVRVNLDHTGLLKITVKVFFKCHSLIAVLNVWWEIISRKKFGGWHSPVWWYLSYATTVGNVRMFKIFHYYRQPNQKQVLSKLLNGTYNIYKFCITTIWC